MPVLCDLLLRHWHDLHEDIVFELGLIGDPIAVDTIRSAASIPFESLVEWGNLAAFQRKCAYALSRIATEQSRLALEVLAKSDDPQLRAYQFIATWEHRDKSYGYYDYLTRDFFRYLAGLSASQAHWLAPGSGSYVYRGAAFQHKARSAELRAQEAIASQAQSYNWTARQKYREIYGTLFPD